MSPDENRGKTLKYLVLISQIGISMTVPIVAGIFLGKILDDKLGTNVLFLAIFSIIGIVVAFMNLFKMVTHDFNRK
ncbi:AtpZ/AtpI family protein [Clostridium sp. D2Q-11]|uniref:AtpZ/AtpI family protein n=1 Tax=Anaeromonas frigoriresistens TaxID=2683708 RepID=A0A942UVM7_9FIRM|nr:AtpZ/AtpI family protein [Anaeromonas frigoriresistens]MBS4538330.1 AtpZ/AtpI family protein [Anaeromonas frigoriresistens]